MPALSLTLKPGRFAICRFPGGSPVPAWALGRRVFAVVAREGELSVLCPEEHVPAETRSEAGWRLLELAGPFPFEATGILASVLGPLAAAGVGILALSTFDTDLVLVKEERLEEALAALRAAGHAVS